MGFKRQDLPVSEPQPLSPGAWRELSSGRTQSCSFQKYKVDVNIFCTLFLKGSQLL